jgi:peptide/nickel transport system substrate-binding protein
VLQEPSLRVIMFGLNQKDDVLHANKKENPLKDLRVRKALYQAIDMELIKKRIMRDKSRNTALLVAPAVPGYDKSLDNRMPFDPDAAKTLLAEAGYPDGFVTGLDCPNDRYVNDEEICVAVAGMWAKIGVKTDLVTQTKSKHFKKVFTGGSDIYMIGWATLPQMDAISVISSLLASPGKTFGGDNAGGYANARVDELTQKIVNEVDETQRRAMLTEALKIARDEVAMIPLHEQPNSWAMRDNVDIPMQPDSFLRLWLAKVK